MKIKLLYLIGIIIGLSLSTSTAYAHSSVNVGEYEIELGWETEPPVVGLRNNLVFEISVPEEVEGVKTGVKSAFYNLDAIIKFGGVTKKLDINSDPIPGHYYSSILPTKIGSMSVMINGEIDGTSIDVEIPIEDIENTAVLDFPPRKETSSDSDVFALQSSLKNMQEEISRIKANPSGENTGNAYDFSVLALSLSVSGVVLGIVAMLKRS